MGVQLKICRGKDCIRRTEDWEALWELESDNVSVSRSKCLDYCKGPVIQIRRGRRKYWFRKVRGEAIRRDLRTFLEEGSMSTALVRRLVRVS